MEPDCSGNTLRLIGVPGTNKVMAGELSRLARRAFADVRVPNPRKEGQGALAYPFDRRLAALAVHYQRTASRALWGLYESRAARLEPLYDDLLAAVAGDGRPWAWDGATFSVRPANLGPFAAGGRQVVGVVKNAVVAGLAARDVALRVDPEAPDLCLDVRLHEDRVVVSLDLAGRPLGQRGYRLDRGAAPLRENLAAVLVMLSRHDPRREALLDPMAGSGTIAIEAACMAQGRPLWVPPRTPLADAMPAFREVPGVPTGPLFGDTPPVVWANELDASAHAASRANQERAGVAQWIDASRGDFRDLDPGRVCARVAARGLEPTRGVILCNPPYGERLADGELATLYRDLGRWCRRFAGWRAGFLVANRTFEEAFGGRPRIKKPISNGPLRGYFFLYDL